MSKLLFKKLKNRLGFGWQVRRRYQDINPEDIFLDSENLPGFEEHALEGRIEKPMGGSAFTGIKVILILLVCMLSLKLWSLSVVKGETYAELSENNRLEHTLIFANRGAILDRNGVELATNSVKDDPTDYAGRLYAPIEGLSHVVGYIKYPQKDKAGNFYDTEYRAKDGVELVYDEILRGKEGLKLKETDVLGNVTSESIVEEPQDGGTLTLSLDALVNQELHQAIKSLAQTSNFVGGAGVIMDVETGEILVLTSYPEYDQNELTSGLSQTAFNKLLNNPSTPFLNRVVGGLYTPGSIVKPIVALGALNENLISPFKEIYSSGSITVPNPYDPEKPSVFGDWKAHGYTAMREALAVSSDTYFYSIGGGFGDQKGLGISLIDKYLTQFGLTEKTGIELFGELSGVIPTPAWKAERFNGDIWRLGDTYITSIGQYGTQISPINAVRFTAALANQGKLLKPSLLRGGVGDPVVKTLKFDDEDWKVVREGMREGVAYGTSVGLNVPYVEAAGKTGTAEIGSGKRYVHSWSVGFFPYDKPRYAWAVIMEKGPATNIFGATGVMRHVFDWMSIYAPEYFTEEASVSR
jgi:penicillin-binding protein 2